jgi:hypothetical protein
MLGDDAGTGLQYGRGTHIAFGVKKLRHADFFS